MSVSRLASGRWRAQVYNPALKRNVSVGSVLGGAGTFATKREAKAAREAARQKLGSKTSAVTVGEFRERWLTDPLFAWPKESTRIHNRQKTKHFTEKHGHLPLDAITDEIVSEWLAEKPHTASSLRAMFNAAASPKGGRLIQHNPFARLGIRKSKGNADKDPPPEQMVWELIKQARVVAFPAFAAWLQVAAFTGMRPGELDALRWESVDLDRNRILVREQWNASSETFTSPKNGRSRVSLLTPPAREALVGLARESEWCFTGLRGSHFRPSMRRFHWSVVRAAAGYEGTLYLATRHFFGSYAINVLGLSSEDVAIALGHEDGGDLVRRLYGHRDRNLALDRVAASFEQRSNVRPLRVVKEDTA